MVLDKGHRIALVVGLHVQTLAAARQRSPRVVVDRVADGVADGEVKGCALDDAIHLGTVNPRLEGTQVAVPILAHRIGGVDRSVIDTRIRWRITPGHIVTEACIFHIVEQHIQVTLDDKLHIAAGVVQVTQAAPILTTVVVGAQGLAVLVCPCQRGSAVIITADVGGQQFVAHTPIGLSREGHPVVQALAMVDDHIGNGADALAIEGVDH